MTKRLYLILTCSIVFIGIFTTQIITAQDDDDDDSNPQCPQSQGHWKNHPGDWILTSLQIGSQMYSQAELLVILNTPTQGDASLILAKQLIALKLNLATGTDPTIVNDLIIQADSLLAQFQGKLPYNVPPSSTEGQAFVNFGSIFEVYNHGQLITTCIGTPTPTPEEALIATPATITPEATPTFITLTPGTTPTLGTTTPAAPTVTPQATATSIDDDAVIIVIEGPVQEININIITIYDIDIVLAPDDPLLTVIQIGDVIRVEGAIDDDGPTIVIIAITIIIIDVDVFIGDDGSVWRDPGDCGNPPPDWAPANGWRRRCEGGGGNSGGGNGGRGGRGRDDDDDDDD